MDDNYYENCDYYDDYSAEEDDNSEQSSEEESSSDEESSGESEDEDIEEEDTSKVVEEVNLCNKYYGMSFLTKFEKARILGIRAEQILAGSKVFVETDAKDPYSIALEELKQKKIPLLVRRYFGNKYKDVSVNKLKII